MADDLAPTDPTTPDQGGASSSADTSTATPDLDTRAIAASVFAAGGDTETDPPPVEPSTPSITPDAATRVGEDDDPEYQTLLASGSMPVDRHKAVLTNARNKTRAEVENAARLKYGWVDDLNVDRARAENALGLMRALDANPQQALRTLAHALGVDFTPPAPTVPDGPPAADVKLDDGSEFYSAPQLAKLQAWQEKQYDRKLDAIDKRYAPLIEERHLSKLRELASAEATTTLAECRAEWRHFVALEHDIKALMQATPDLSLDRAYIKALAVKEADLDRQSRSQLASDRASQLQRKAAASHPGPGAARPVTPLKYSERSTRDIAAEVFARSGG